jgi:hypothetical protein
MKSSDQDDSPRKPKPSSRKEDEDEEEEDRKTPPRSNDSHTEASTDQSMLSCSSSAVPAAAALTPPTAKGAELRLHLSPIQESSTPLPLPRIQNQVFFLSGTALLSFITFLYYVIPFTALFALGGSLVSISLMFHQVYQFLRQEYGDIVNGRGIGDYLPGWVFRALTESSLHDQLTDDSFELEYRHLMLYFMPGLSRAQLDAYVDRLAPRHRGVLLRPGLGHLLGDSFMQVVMGRERFPTAVPPSIGHNEGILPLLENGSIPSTPVRRRLDLDDDDSDADSDLGLDVSGDDLAGGLSNRQAEQMARTLRLPPSSTPSIRTPAMRTPSIPEEAIVSVNTTATPNAAAVEESQNEEELAILTEALWQTYVSSFYAPAVNTMSTAVTQWAQNVTEWITSPTMSITVVSGSVGLFGYWHGIWGRPTNRAASTRDVWTTAVLGGGVAGILFMARTVAQSAREASEREASKKKKDGGRS